MRWVRDITLLLLLAAIGTGIVWWQVDKHEDAVKLDKTTADTQRLEREVRFRAATKKGELNYRGWPVTVEPTWFDVDPPQNRLVSDDRPWVEVASEDEAGLTHPRMRMTIDEKAAAFWYNPYQGIVRARVPVTVNDQMATALYNTANQTTITSIQWIEMAVEIPKPIADKVEVMGPPEPPEPPMVVVHPPKAKQ